MIIALVDPDDPHLQLVARHISPQILVTIDPKAIIAGDALTFEIDRSGTTLVYKEVKLTDVRSVWCRASFEEPLRKTPLTVAPRYQRFARRTIRHFITGLYAEFSEAMWVSPYFAAFHASYKPLQLKTARRLGFRVPETIITNDEQAAAAFTAAQGAVIAKPLASQAIREEGRKPTVILAAKLAKKQTQFPNLHLAPTIFQQAIDVAADIRVMVVGDQVFAASIEVDERSGSPVRDWRAGQLDNSLRVSEFTLPASIIDKCRRLVREFDLRYGAIDLILDTAGQLWFLENNTSGAWGFVEKATGQPISRAIAQLLLRGNA